MKTPAEAFALANLSRFCWVNTVAPMRETLAEAGLDFRIEPPFPW